MKRKSIAPASPEPAVAPRSRRNFLQAATGVAAGATLGFPMIAKGQTGPITMRFQSTWPSKDIFHEYAQDYAKKVNDMTGGDLKIEVLPAGAVVPGVRPARGGVEGHARRRPRRARLPLRQEHCAGAVGLGPGVRHGREHAARRGTATAAARSCWQKIYQSIGANVVSFPYGPMPTQPLGWFKKPVTKAEDFKGLKYRTVGISIDLFTAMGAAVNALPGGEIVPAMDRGLLDAAEFNNMTSDRMLGFPDVSKVCMLQSFHQNAEQFEIMFNKTKYDALPAKLRAIIAYAVDAASAGPDLEGDRPLLEGLRRAADQGQGEVLQDARLDPAEAARGLRPDRRQEVSRESAVQGDRRLAAAFAERAVTWDMDNNVNRRMAYNHYFGPEDSRADQEGLTPGRARRAPSRTEPGWCLVFAMTRAEPWTVMNVQTLSALRRPHQHVGRQGRCLADRRADARRLRRGVQALHPERADGVDLRRQQHDVRHAVHDVRRLHARAGRPRARRFPLRLDEAAHAGERSTSCCTSCSSCPASSALMYAGYDYARRLVAHPRALERHRRRAAGLPVQDDHPDRRRAGAAAGPGGDRALRRLPADRRSGRSA